MKRILQLTLFTAALILGSMASQVMAQADYYWTGASTNDNWNTPGNWIRGAIGGNAATFTIATAAPGTTDNIYFDAAYYDFLNNTPSIVNISGDVFGANIDASKAATSGSATSIFSLTGNGTLYIHGSLNLPTGITNSYTGTINFSGASPATIRAGIPVYNLAVSKSNMVTLQTPVTVLNDLTINSGTLADGGFQITGSATGSLSMASGTRLNLAASFPTSLLKARILVAASSEIIYSSSAAQTVSAEPAYGSLVITGASIKTLAGPITVAGNLTVSSGTLKAGNLTNTITLSGNWITNGGSFVHSNSSVTFNGSAASTLNTGSDFYNLIISKDVNLASIVSVQGDLDITSGILDDKGFQITGNNAGNLKITGNLSLGSATTATTFPAFVNNKITLNTGSTVIYAAGVNQMIRGLSGATTGSYSNLTLSNPGTALVNKMLDATTIVRSTLAINANNNLVDNGSQINNTMVANSTLSMAANSILTLGNTATATKFPEFASQSLIAGSTVVYNSGLPQIIAGTVSYQNLTLNSTVAVTKTLSSDVTIKGNLNIGTNNTLDVSSTNNTGSIRNIDIAGNWLSNGTFLARTGTVTFAGSANSAIDVLNTNNNFNNLTINNTTASTSATLAKPIVVSNNLTISQGVLNANGQSINVGGNWVSNATGTLVHGGNTVTFDGSTAATITTASVFNNLTINKAGTATLGSNITVENNLTLTTGTLAANTRTINLQGNWSGSGIFNAGTGTVRFYGNINSTINPASNLDLYNLIIAKSSKANTVTLGTMVTILTNGAVTFTTGIIKATTSYPMTKQGDPDVKLTANPTSTNPGYMLIISDDANAVGASHNSHVDGFVRKNGNDNFEFPIGNGEYYRPAGITLKDNGSFSYDARYVNRISTGDKSYNTKSLRSPLASVSEYEYWYIITVNPNSSPSIWLSWEMPISGGFKDANYINKDNLWMLTTAAWLDNAAWESRGKANFQIQDSNPATFRGRFEAGSATNGNTNMFTIGSIFNALPIDLLYFRAAAAENNVQLDWATAQEINNDYFTIERSADGKNFTQVTTVNGKGNSKEVSKYSAVDYSPYSGVTYYRLKQTDFDGKFTYSKTVAVEMNTVINSLQAYSVGSKALQLNYKVGGEENGALTIHDSRGVQVWSKLVSGTAAEIKEEVNMQSAANGMYIISLQTASGTITKKVMVF